MLSSPPAFIIGSMVQWVEDIPSSWRFIYTPGPMKVIKCFYQNGIPTDYAMKFSPEGMNFQPGWIYEVEFPFNESGYHEFPYHLGNTTHVIHEMWLKSYTITGVK